MPRSFEAPKSAPTVPTVNTSECAKLMNRRTP